MSKRVKKIDRSTLSLFQNPANGNEYTPAPGSFDIDRRLRESISVGLKTCPLSRYEVAAKLSEFTGQDITKTMLDSWTAESKDQHRFPAIFLPAFCYVTGWNEPLTILAQPIGAFVVPGPDVLKAEVQRLDDEIKQKEQQRKLKILLLKELGG